MSFYDLGTKVSEMELSVYRGSKFCWAQGAAEGPESARSERETKWQSCVMRTADICGV